MTKMISTAKASAQLDELIRKANQKSARFIVGKLGEPAGVLVGIGDYIRIFAPEPDVLKVIGAQSKRKGTDKLTMRQIDREIAAYRKEKRTESSRDGKVPGTGSVSGCVESRSSPSGKLPGSPVASWKCLI